MTPFLRNSFIIFWICFLDKSNSSISLIWVISGFSSNFCNISSFLSTPFRLPSDYALILPLVTCSHHLNPRFWSGGFLLNDSNEPSIYKLSSRAPRFFLPDTGVFSYLLSGYGQFILPASFLPLHGYWSLHFHLCPSHFHTCSGILFQIIPALFLSFRIYCIFCLKGKTVYLY